MALIAAGVSAGRAEGAAAFLIGRHLAEQPSLGGVAPPLERLLRPPRVPAFAVESIERSTAPWSCSSTPARLGRSSGLRERHCVASCSSRLGQHKDVTPSSGETLP